MNILFLDDCPNRTRKFRSLLPSADTCFTAKECIDKLYTQEWDWVFLDHDLGGETYQNSEEFNTGMQVVREMIARRAEVHRVIVHSLNYYAAQTMVDLLKQYGYNAKYNSFLDIEDFIRTKIMGYLG